MSTRALGEATRTVDRSADLRLVLDHLEPERHTGTRR